MLAFMRRGLAAILGVGALVGGCGDASTDKAGGKAGDVRVLRLANANDNVGELAAFAREVERASGGLLRIRFLNDYRRGDPGDRGDAEPGILDDVRAGKIDLAWVGARAFKAEGVDAFDPLIAPFAVMDYETQQRVLTNPVAADMLDAVGRAGMHGVALLPGPLRRLGMRAPWRTPDDLNGKRISAPAGIGSEGLKALGAVTVVTGTGGSAAGLDGVEEHLGSFLGNGRMRDTPYVATQALWPRPLVVVAAPKLWDDLDEADRKILTEAGEAAVASTLDDIKATDAEALPKLCRSGVRFFDADLAALRTAAEPVFADIRRDPATAKSLASIEKLRADSAPQTLACPKSSRRAAEGGLPPGTYTWTLTLQDGRRRPYGRDVIHELPDVFRADITPGHMVLWVSSKGKPEEVGLEADYSTFKDRIDIDNGGITGRWRVDGDGNLHFSDIKPKGGDVFVFETHPWKRVR